MKILAVLTVLLAVAAFATRPDAKALDDKIVGDLTVEASNLGMKAEDGLIAGVAKLACSVNPDDCARLIRASMTIELDELYVARRATVTFRDRPAMSCIGVFTQWTCRTDG